MRILQVHNYYRTSAPSGENNVVDAERTLLRKSGHTVGTFFRYNDNLEKMGTKGLLIGAAATPWNPFAAKRLKRTVDDFDADVIHVHNTFPQLSPAIFSSVPGKTGRVLTMHNYRLVCPAALPMRDGEVCIECIEKRSALPALKYGCYRGSRAATVPLAAKVMLNRALGTWQKHVDAFIVLTEFQRDLMVSSGFPSELIHVKPNFYPGDPNVTPFELRPKRILFIGRLTREKGVHTLIEAWRQWGVDVPDLRIAGDGELRSELEVKAAGLPITFLGQVDHKTVVEELSNARLLVVPSEWFEGFPMVLQEAFALGTPVAVSNIGPLANLSKEGAIGGVFNPKDPISLKAEVQRIWGDQDVLALKALGARRTFEEEYTEAANVEALERIYKAAKAVKRERIES